MCIGSCIKPCIIPGIRPTYMFLGSSRVFRIREVWFQLLLSWYLSCDELAVNHTGNSSQNSLNMFFVCRSVDIVCFKAFHRSATSLFTSGALCVHDCDKVIPVRATNRGEVYLPYQWEDTRALSSELVTQRQSNKWERAAICPFTGIHRSCDVIMPLLMHAKE